MLNMDFYRLLKNIIFIKINKLMKNFFILLYIYLTTLILSCNSGASKIEITNVNQHRNYQDSILALYKTPNEKLNALKQLVSEYRNLKIENKEKNSNYLYLIGRLYSTLFSESQFHFNGTIYDTINKKLFDSSTYINYIDSSLYFSEQAVILNPKDIRSMVNFCNTWFYDFYYYGNKIKENISMPYSYNRNPKQWNERLTFIINNANRFYDIDESVKKENSKLIIYTSYTMLNSIINVNNFNYNDDNTLATMIKWGESYNYLKSIKEFRFSESDELLNKNFLPTLNKASKIYKEKHEWDNVTSEQYHNCEQMNLWLYSNGKYKQETYELDISSIPYHDRMNLTGVEIACCTAPGGKKILTNRSEGNYKIDGSIIYFYPNPGSGIMIAGIDPEKNTRYMKINSYGNLEYLRENDYETVLLNKR